MPQQIKIFRVFVSSTFTDMREERKILQSIIFPKLERYCEKKGARFQGVDLRWGVTEESQRNQQTIRICLNEIDRCKRISPKPNFLVLLGDKYGWQPIPPVIPSEEMNSILSATEHDEEKIMIRKWYRLDENAVPPEFILQPRDDEFKDDTDWSKTENKIRETLRNAINKCTFTETQKVRYFASATHQEIIRGALSQVGDNSDQEDHVFAFVRQLDGLPENESALDFRDIVNGRPDPFTVSNLAELKAQLHSRLNEKNIIHYRAKWLNGASALDDPLNFERIVYKKLRRIIDSQIQDIIDPDEIDYEKKLHEEFKVRLTEHFRGRTETIQKIKDYLNNPAEKRMMALTGNSGSGKSSVLAELIRQSEMDHENALFVYRFIGVTSRSSNVIYLLQSICGQIARHFDVTLESLAGRGNEKSLYDLHGLSVILEKCLQRATPEKQVIVLLDALDQLSDTDNARDLQWLPIDLPLNTRFIVSALPDLENGLSKCYTDYLPVLPEPEARQILDQWLSSVKRTLTKLQYERVITAFSGTGLAIYLRLAFEQARLWHSYEEIFDLKEDMKGIIHDFFDHLHTEHTPELVTHAVSYLLSGKYQGLAENEILEVLAFDDEFWEIFIKNTHEDHRQELIEQKLALPKGSMKIPIAVWSRLYLDLEPFLTERDADGVPIISFFHRQFIEVLKEKYGL